MRNLKNELYKINNKMDRIVDTLKMQELKMQEMDNRESKCCASKSEDITYKIYEIVSRMKFNNDIQDIEKKHNEVNEQIKKLEREREYIIAEKLDIERKYYSGK